MATPSLPKRRPARKPRNAGPTAPPTAGPAGAPRPGEPLTLAEPLTWRHLDERLSNLAALLDNLAEPAVRNLTDDLYVAPGALHYLADTVRELAERCGANEDQAAQSAAPAEAAR
jgi:hypothetical protein